MLDERDRKILDLLQTDAGISVTDLADRVALSVSACSRRKLGRATNYEAASAADLAA